MKRGLWVIALSAMLAGACGGDGGGFTAVEGAPEARMYGAVWSFAADDVYVTADQGRVLHFDGADWEETQLDTHDTMLGIWAFARDDVWMVGGDSLARFDGDAWSVTNLPAQNAGISGVNAIWGSAPDDVWVVGTQSTAAHWDGSTWQRYIAAGTENHAVWGSGPDDVYVLGTFGIAHWDGTALTDLELDLFSGEGVWGFGSDDVWITDEDTLAHFTGGEWETVELDFFAGPRVLWGNAPDDLWGVGEFGSITHYDGTRWNEVSRQPFDSPFLRSFTRVHGSDDGDVWIIGTQSGVNGVEPLLWRRGG